MARGLVVAAALASSVDAQCRCTDSNSRCWPSDKDWAALNTTVGGRLVSGANAASPVEACSSAGEQDCAEALSRSAATEFWNRKFPGGFQSTGLIEGFATTASEVALRAKSAEDVSAAVRFAAKHDLRLTVKGSGHDYMGRNTAKGSLLISTAEMMEMTWGNSTVTVAAGVPWQDVYEAAQARGLYVQGGHCPSVGAVGGFSAGGGFGPNSRMYGTGADNMVAAQVVIADGSILDVDEETHADLFWALRGGGGGTFGVVTSITYRAHPAPKQGGSMSGALQCETEEAFVQQLAAFLAFAQNSLMTPHWGDGATPDGSSLSLSFGLRYIGLARDEAQQVWASLEAAPGCSWTRPLNFQDFDKITLDDGSRVVKQYPYPGAFRPHTGDPDVDSRLVDGFLGQLNQWSFGQAHRYILAEEIQSDAAAVAKKLLELTKFRTSYRVLQFSKALFGAGNAGNVSSNPVVRQAAVALMGNEHVANYFPEQPRNRVTLSNFVRNGGVQGFFDSALCPERPDQSCLDSPDSLTEEAVDSCWQTMLGCFKHRSEQFHGVYVPKLRELFDAGSYGNEGDYFEQDWQRLFFGINYGQLLQVKRAVDPQGLFVCHHCVGSEDWTADGNCRQAPELVV